MNGLVTKSLQYFIYISRLWLRYLFMLNKKVNARYDIDRHKHAVLRAVRRHDMVQNKDEEFYAQQYWRLIKEVLDRSSDEQGVHVDLGCGQGRFSFLLADWIKSCGGEIIGVDLSEFAIKAACKEAKLRECENVNFLAVDIAEYIKGAEENSIDTIMCLEVLYMLPNYRDLLEAAVRVLKPGGLLILSFRPQLYNALYAMQSGDWDSFDVLVKSRAAQLWGGDAQLNWHTSEEVKNLLVTDLNLRLELLAGIGCCSGISGDPHASFVKPSTLSASEREQLMALELGLSISAPDAGRYMLAIAQKSSGN